MGEGAGFTVSFEELFTSPFSITACSPATIATPLQTGQPSGAGKHESSTRTHRLYFFEHETQIVYPCPS